MSTNIDWRVELDRAIEHGTDRPVAEYVVSGHRAVRRRRIAASVASLAAAVVVAGVAWTALPGNGPAGAKSHVASGGASASATPTRGTYSGPELSDVGWSDSTPPARVTAGAVQIRPGAVVHDRRDDIYPGKDTESVALDVTHHGKRWWTVLEWDDDGSTVQFVHPDDVGVSFDEYVAETAADGGMYDMPAGDAADRFTYAGLADFTTRGLQLRDGVTLVRRVDNPHGVEAPRTSVGAVLEHQGTTTWLSAIADEHVTSGTAQDASESGWLTFDQWLAADVALQAGEPGLVLVGFGPDGTLVPREPGVDVLDQQVDPDVPGLAEDSAEASGAAMVRWRGDLWFTLVVRYVGEDTNIPFAAAKTDGTDTLDEFLVFARKTLSAGHLR